MALSEIEKLERRYAENPQGLTFAPLAEVHRKNGDVARALELLRLGLTLHPDYIPASIVLGRCHLDLGELPAAETAFTHVLSLDGENVIALKALADIAERQFRFDESERWLRTLLAIDRSNDEAREQLIRVEASRLQAGTASSASPDAAAALAPDEAPALTQPITEPITGAEVPTAAAPEPAVSEPAGSRPAGSGPAEPELPSQPISGLVEASGSAAAAEPPPLELEELDLAHLDEPAPPAGMEVEQSVTLDEPVEPLSGLVGRHDQESGSDLHVSSDSWQVEMAEDIVLNSAGASEFQMANAAEELLDSAVGHAEPSLGERPPMEREEPPAADAASEEPATTATAEPASQDGMESAASPPASAESVAPESGSVAEAADIVSPSTDRVAAEGGATEAGWAPPAAESPGQSEADLLVTESMAELLLEQGHTTEALIVYRHLESRTGSPRFRDKVAELERKSAPTAAAPFTMQSAASPAAGEESGAAESPPTPAYSVQQTHGQSVSAFLRGVLSARPPAASSMPAQAGSKVAAPDASASGAPTRPAHDSLSLSSVFGEESTPTPPAVPAAGAGTGSGGVSYDEFFGTASSGPARPSRTPDAKSDDLDQFHAWLQNLKR